MASEEKIIISAVDKASSILESAGKNWKKFATVVGTAAVAIGTKAVIEAAKFEKQMSNITTLISGDSTKAIQGLETGIKSLIATTPTSPEELGSAAYDIFSAGITNTSDALQVLEYSSKLAVAGLGTTQEATDLMTSAINAFGLSADQSNDVANTLFNTVKQGKTTVSELSMSFGQLAPVAVAAGVSFQEVQAATAALTTTGLSASVAQNSMRQLFVEMTKEGNKLSSALHDIGIANIEAAIQADGFVPTLERLKKEANLTDSEFKNLFGSVEAQGAALALTGSVSEAYIATMQEMTTGSKNLEEAFAKQLETTAAQWQLLKNNLNVALVNLGSAILPVVNEALGVVNEALGKVTQGFKDIDEWIEITTANIKMAYKPAQDYADVHSEISSKVEEATGKEKEFLEMVETVTLRSEHAYKALKDGHNKAFSEIIKIKDEDVARLRDWLAENEGSLDLSKLAYMDFSEKAIVAIAEVDIELAKSISSKQAQGSDLMGGLITGMNSQTENLGSTVNMIMGILKRLEFSYNPELPTEVWGQHLMQNLIEGVQSKYGNLNESVTGVMGIIKRLQFSTNPELPTEVWGRHLVENFEAGMREVYPGIDEAVVDFIDIFLKLEKELELSFENNIDGFKALENEFQQTFQNVSSTVDALNNKLLGINAEYDEKVQKEKMKLAVAIVGQEEKIKDLQEEIAKETNVVKLAELKNQLQQEVDAKTQFNAQIAELESEVTEVKRVNGLTQLELAFENYEKEMAKAKELKDLKLQALQEELAEVKEVFPELEKLWELRSEKIEFLIGKEKKAAEALTQEWNNSKKALEELLSKMQELDGATGSSSKSKSQSGLQKKAAGGPVTAGMPYEVGESGRELFVPNVSGTIIPHNKLAGAGGITLNITVNGDVSGDDLIQKVGNALIEQLKPHAKII